MITNIDGTQIICDILTEILKRKISESLKCSIINLAAKYDHNIVRGRREIIHLEAFIVSIMNELYCDSNKPKSLQKIEKTNI